MSQKPPLRKNFNVAVLVVWAVLMVTAFSSSSAFLLTSFSKASTEGNLGFYGAQSPQVLGASFETESVDPRSLKIEKIFEKYKCPLAGQGSYIVQMADEHNIPYWLVPAVSFQESGCGKKTPNVAGIGESFNAWGYGVYGGKVRTFEGWEQGIETLSKYFDKNFFSRGITDPCQIMRTYTPSSKGSWCAGVKYFGEMIENFETE